MDPDCVKKRAAKTYSRFMVGKKAELAEHPVRRKVEFTNDPNMAAGIYFCEEESWTKSNSKSSQRLRVYPEK